MRLSLSTTTFFCILLSSGVEAFLTPSVSTTAAARCSTRSTSSSALASTTAEEAAQIARQKAEAATQKPVTPKLFDEDLLTDMQECLEKLERRVKDGPGALSFLDAELFDFATQRILEEMKRNEHNRPKPAPAFPDVQVEEKATGSKAAAASVAGASDDDHNPEEGAAFNGTNGFGLAQGTTNTYVIPGMDEMSPEEYQKALQKSVSDRQANRVKAGNYGNKATWDYLNNLGSSNTAMKKRWDPKEQGN